MAGVDFGSELRRLVEIQRRNNPELSASARVKRAWNACVEPRIANHVTAVFVVPNTNASEVIIYVDDSIWATELSLQSELMRLNLNVKINEDMDYLDSVSSNTEQVEKLIFKVSKEKYVSKERRMTTRQQLDQEEERYRKAQPIALSDEEMVDLHQALSNIDNDVLRDVAYSAAKANLEWQKGIEKLGA